MSQEQLTPELLQADPAAYWKLVNKLTQEKLAEMLKDSLTKTISLHREHYGQLLSLCTLQAKELMYFRELETRIRNNSLTDEALSDILRRLDEFRAEVSAKLQATNSQSETQ